MADDTQKKEGTGVAPAPEPEYVQVKKEDLNKMLETLSRQSNDIKVLYDAADKSRLAAVRNASELDKLVHTCKISKWRNNKLIIAWQLTSNISEIVAGRWVEDQKVTLFFDDGTKEEGILLLDFYRHRTPVVGEILKRETTVDSNRNEVIMFTVHFPDGKELKISSVFINL